MAGVFAGVLRQLALGLFIGSFISAAVLSNIGPSVTEAAALLLAVAAIILVAGVLAAFGPARQALRIQASEALRADA